MEPRAEGLRVKLTYLGVESGVLFPWEGSSAIPTALDRVYEVLAWRVIRPPA